jgi:hypothetical protein
VFRAWFICILIFSLFGKVFFQLGWELWFLKNQEAISLTLCENKAKPMLNCNGKCYLSKQLRKLEIESERRKSEEKHNPYLSIQAKWHYISNPSKLVDVAFELTESTPNPDYPNSYNYLFSNSIFQPPCV